ncbi:S66 peptidase family protein [Paenibacillus qinlingensis]|uniref:S66 peptidase family protein n=1 Tax=Paenibacillus qinlingensis TaxID=1837343 RepID=UPI001564AD07|nr:S66 peptidase family protein [Paenibacillus qinlingensis]NQX61469.1 LD-carboxypeptidase [Paenibacillus qinlingensis]
MIKPKRLKSGSKIAIISPSNGLPYLFPDIYEMGLKHLGEVFGLEVVEMPSARMSPEELYKNPQLRAQDINDCFENEEIDGIITSIGGYESVRILPFLNKDLIMSHPKFIMGFSDATTFLTYLNNWGMVTFYGPSIMAGIAQLSSLPKAYSEHLKAIWFEEQFPYRYTPYQEWTNGYKDWSHLETLGECQPFVANENGWTFIQGEAIEQGYLWGGCIEVLEFMKSTIYWPKDDCWQDRVLFFETSEEKPSPMQVGYMLRNYGMQGIFSRVKGVIFGRAKDYSVAENAELREILVTIIAKEFGAGHVPIVVDFDFGHTDPKLILPLGGRVELNPGTNEVILLESPFE